ncbi:hypothetical protein V1511DRAFT_491013 [Dipodascopsis uninucleata]
MEVDSASLASSGIIKKLAANDRPTREEGITILTKYLSTDEKISELDFLKVWKGLYYCMWMTDRPKVQQAMADRLAGLVLLPREVNVIAFVQAFWDTICREWSKIDVLRMDKFYLLLRRFVNAMFRRLLTDKWNAREIKSFNDVLQEFPLNPTNTGISDGIRYHMIDIYVDELFRCIDCDKSAVKPENARSNNSDSDDNNDHSDTYGNQDDETESHEVSNHTIAQLMKPFEILSQKSVSKVVKKRVYEEVLHDVRLAETWNYDPSKVSKPVSERPKSSAPNRKKIRTH